MRITWTIGLVLAGGCFTDPGGTLGPMSASTGTSTDAPASTGAPTSTGGSSSGEPTGTTMGEGADCDPWAQDCDAGLKCAPYATDNGDSWDANKCTPAGEGVPGGPCIAMMSATSGYDTCEAGAVCWDVDPGTLAGVCHALCDGSPGTPICSPGSVCSMTNEGAVNICLIACDPLLAPCQAKQVCVPDADDHFLCVGAADTVPKGFPCGYINECEPDSMCAEASKWSKCDQEMPGCCIAYCDVDVPMACDPFACVPYFPVGEAPAGLEDLGLCQDPV